MSDHGLNFSKSPPRIGGFFLSHPELAMRIEPVSGLIGQEDADSAMIEWQADCCDAAEFYADCGKEYQYEVQAGIDTHADIEPILRMARPRDALRTLLERIRKDYAGAPIGDCWIPKRGPSNNLRGQVICGIEAQVALRPRSWSEFKCCHLRPWGGKWLLKMEAKHFKNGNSARFKGGFFCTELEDVQGLYDALDDYCSWGRAAILDGAPDLDYLYVSERNGGRIAPAVISNEFRRLTEKYLIAGPDGMRSQGVQPFAPRAFRAIIATCVLKATNSLIAAADAIHDTPAVVYRHYARYVPDSMRAQLAKQIREILGNVRE